MEILPPGLESKGDAGIEKILGEGITAPNKMKCQPALPYIFCIWVNERDVCFEAHFKWFQFLKLSSFEQ